MVLHLLERGVRSFPVVPVITVLPKGKGLPRAVRGGSVAGAATFAVLVLCLLAGFRGQAQTRCALMPIGVSEQSLEGLQAGDTIPDAFYGGGPGNFGWLTWQGSPAMPVLLGSLTPEGNSETYLNPDDPSDHILNEGDWVQGRPGVSNSKKIRQALDRLKDIDIVVPVWDQARGRGNRLDYRVGAFAQVRLLDYRLARKNRITARFLGYVHCNLANLPPVAIDDLITIAEDSGPIQFNLLADNGSGADHDPDSPLQPESVTVLEQPQSGELEPLGGGTYAYLAPTNFHGTNLFTYRLSETLEGVAYTGNVATVTLVAEPVNDPPTVDAGPDLEVAFGEPIELEGQAGDVELAEGGRLAVGWSQVSGPGFAFIPDGTNPIATATVSAPGLYQLSLSATDGEAAATDTMTLIVEPQGGNQPPTVDAGPDLDLAHTDTVRLEGTVTDDGFPIDGGLTLAWRQLSGPAIATFEDPASPTTQATFPADGVYVFELSASDGELTAQQSLTATVHRANQPPAVHAGNDRTLTAPTATLEGAVTDDGLPAGGALSVLWEKVSGPGEVTFRDPARPVTEAAFETTGEYLLRLSAGDGQLQSSDEIRLTLSGNLPPVVDAGPDRSLELILAPELPEPVVILPEQSKEWILDAGQPGLDPELPWGGGNAFSISRHALATLGNGDLVVSAGFQQAGGDGSIFGTARWSCGNWFSLDPEGATFHRLVSGVQFVDARGNEIFGRVNAVTGHIYSRYDGTHWLGWGPHELFGTSAATVARATGERVYFAPNTAFQPIEFDDPRIDSAHPRSPVLENGVPSPPVSRSIAVWTEAEGWEPLGEGVFDFTSDPGVFPYRNGTIHDIAVAEDGSVYVTGFFQQAGQVPAANIARWDGEQWHALGGGLGGCEGFACKTAGYTLALAPNGDLYAGGNFRQAGSTPVRHLARWDGSQWHDVGGGVVGEVYSLAFHDGELFVGGRFGYTGSNLRVDNIARWDGSTWRAILSQNRTINVGVTGTVRSLEATPTGVYLGINPFGSQNQVRVGDTYAGFIAKWGIRQLPTLVPPEPVLLEGVPESGAEVILTAEVGHPCPYPLTVTWSLVDAAGDTLQLTNVVEALAFTPSREISITNRFPLGIHTVTLSVDDGLAPPVIGTTTLALIGGSSITLEGSFSDDGLPDPPGAITTQWEQVDGPGTATFTDPNALDSEVRFDAAGLYRLRLTATDGEYATDDDLLVTVTTPDPVNQRPLANAGEDQSATIYQTVILEGQGTDDGLPARQLTLDWTQTAGPAPATLGQTQTTITNDSPGTVTASLATFAQFPEAGAYRFALTANDSELTHTDEVEIAITDPGNQPPQVDAGPDRTVALSRAATLEASVSDDGLPFGLLNQSWSTLTSPDGQPALIFHRNGQTLARFPSTGTYTLGLEATDGAASAGDQVTLTVLDDTLPPPVVRIDNLEDGDTLTSPRTLFGQIQSPILDSWQLRLRETTPGDSALWTTLGSGTNQLELGTLATFDPTLLLNGIYEVELTATDRLGRSTTTPPLKIIVDGRQKIGVFNLTLLDLEVQTARNPLLILRSYDSRNRKTNDFGIGWTLDLADIRVRQSTTIGRDWEAQKIGRDLPSYGLTRERTPIVSVIFPNGTTYNFYAVLDPPAQIGIPLVYPRVRFLPFPGTRGTLEPMRHGNPPYVGNETVMHGSYPGAAELHDFHGILENDPDSIYNPRLWRFTTADGWVYLIDEENGLQSLTEPGGQTLTLSANGLTHSSGRTIVFQRDQAGRITNIVDSTGTSMEYVYDSEGRLAAFTDRAGHTTTYEYDADHRLFCIVNPEQDKPIVADYDEDGRLIGHQDGNGNRTGYLHDFANNIEITTNRLGHATVVEYDDRGNTIRTVNPRGAEYTFAYDENDNLISETDPLGRTTTYSYDSAGDPITVAGSCCGAITHTYNEHGNVLTTTDQDGYTRTNTWDEAGNLLSTSDPLGGTVAFTYNQQGLVETMTDPKGNLTTYQYDEAGFLTNSISPLGYRTAYEVDENGLLTAIADLGEDPSAETPSESTDGGAAAPAADGGLDPRLFAHSSIERSRRIATHSRAIDRHNGIQQASTTSLPTYVGRRTHYEWDAHGRPIRTLYFQEDLYENVLDDNGRTVESRDPLGRTVQTVYDSAGNVARIVYPDSTEIRYTYDAAGRMTCETDRNGLQTCFEYDEAGNVIRVDFPDGNFITATYNLANELITETDRCGIVYTYTYDDAGNRIRRTDSAGRTWHFEYNTKGAATRVTDPLGRSTEYRYDFLNRLTAVIYPDQTMRSFTWDGRLLSSRTDELGRTTFYRYDAEGRLVGITDPLGRTREFTFDPAGNLIAETRADGETVVHTHDGKNRKIRTDLPDGTSMQWNYDSANRVIRRVDPEGNAWTYGYDAGDNLTAITNSLGQVTRMTYDRFGNLLTRTDPLNRTTTFHYDAQGRPTRTDYPDGSFEETDYNATGNISSVRDRGGRRWFYSYDSLCRLFRIVDPSGIETTFGYDAGDQIVRRTSNGETYRFTYDERGRLETVTAPDGGTRTLLYDPTGRRTGVIDERGHHVRLNYDAAGQLTGIVDPLNQATRFAYDAAGRLLSTTDPESDTTRFQYDTLGRVTGATLPDGSTSSATYDDRGNRTSFTDPNGNTTFFGYDSEGRLTARTNALGFVTRYAYDAGGRLVSVTDANTNTVSFAYDSMSRPTAVTFPDGTKQLTAYDSLGRPVRTVDQAGRTNTFTYSREGQLASVTDPLGHTTHYGYDGQGRLLAETNANQQVLRYQYDAAGRRTRRTLPDGSFETYAYDLAGNLTNKIDFNNRSTRYEYDGLDRLTRIVPDPALPDPPISFTYTPGGRRASMTDANGVTTYVYDARDRLTGKSVQWFGITHAVSLHYRYDANGNVTGTSSSSTNGLDLIYEYDALNRLTRVNDLDLGETVYDYDPVGNLLACTLPNNVVKNFAFDSLDRLTNMVTLHAETNVLDRVDYLLGPAGHRLRAGELSGRQIAYAYDAAHRLTNETVTATAPVAAGSVGYVLDPLGNQLELASSLPGVPSAERQFDANNRLASFTYDANGNPLSGQTVHPGSGQSEAFSDSYDFEDRLIHRDTTFNSQPVSIDLYYDGDGNRIARSVDGEPATFYLVDELNPTGHPQVVEELEPGTDGALHPAVVYTWGYNLISQDRATGAPGSSDPWQAGFYGYDGAGHVRFLTDSSGNLTDAYDYDAYGKLIGASGTTENDFLYRGEQYDPVLGMYYVRARYYHPWTGRFWNRDPFEGFPGDPASRHPYAWNQNDPVNRHDPSGYLSMAESITSISLVPAVRDAMNSLWSGLNSFSHGTAGGSALKFESHEEALFIDSVSAGPGLEIGKREFWAARRGASFLLSLNPYTWMPAGQDDCKYAMLGAEGNLVGYGCPAKHPMFEWEQSPLQKWTENQITGFTTGFQQGVENMVALPGTVAYGYTSLVDVDLAESLFGRQRDHLGRLAYETAGLTANIVDGAYGYANYAYTDAAYGSDFARQNYGAYAGVPARALATGGAVWAGIKENPGYFAGYLGPGVIAAVATGGASAGPALLNLGRKGVSLGRRAAGSGLGLASRGITALANGARAAARATAGPFSIAGRKTLEFCRASKSRLGNSWQQVRTMVSNKGRSPTRDGRFGGVVARNRTEQDFLNIVNATFEDSSVFATATRHRGNIVIQRSDIPLTIQNLKRMQSGNSPFVRNANGEWETLNLHHVGRRDGQIIEILSSHNTYNPTTGGPLHIPGPGGPVRQPRLSQTYWQQRLEDLINAGRISEALLRELGR